jgi:hypothetical protein
MKKSREWPPLWLCGDCLFLEHLRKIDAFAPGAPEGRAGRWW